jgi:hypothetical protein
MQRKIRLLLTANAVVGLTFGLGLLVAPTLLLRVYGLATDSAGLLVARLLGVEFIGFNVATWIAREADPYATGSAARALVRGHVVSEAIGALVSASAALQGLGNPLLWSVVAIYVAFAAAFLSAEITLRDTSRARSGAAARRV